MEKSLGTRLIGQSVKFLFFTFAKDIVENCDITDQLIGGNKSAEDMDDEAKETNATTSINIVSGNRLIKDETFSSSLKVLKTQMKKYAKKLTNKVKEESPAEAENFKKNLEAALQKIFAKYEHLQFFTGAKDKFEGEGMLAIAEYRDKKPFMLFFKHGLKEERVVSLSSCIKTFIQIFFWFGCHFKGLFIPV